MMIGRPDDPQNPRRAEALKGRLSVWGWIAEPIWASGRRPQQRPDTRPLATRCKIFLFYHLQSEGRPHTPYDATITVDGAYDDKFLTYYGIRWVEGTRRET